MSAVFIKFDTQGLGTFFAEPKEPGARIYRREPGRQKAQGRRYQGQVTMPRFIVTFPGTKELAPFLVR